MALPYPTKVILPFDIATAQDMNERHANDVALANGSGLDDGAVTAAKTDFGGDYSTSEVDTGFKWVDGKTIYKKTINFGTLPNATTKSVAHGISNLSYVISADGVAQNPTGVSWQPIPYAHPTSAASQIGLINFTSTTISIITGINRTNFTICYVTLLYTKV